MASLTQKQIDFLSLLKIGESVHVATSNYSINPIESTGWNPKHRTSAQMIKALSEKGYIEADKFWRGATVKRLK